MSEIEKYKKSSKWINILTIIGLLIIIFSIYWFVNNQEELVTEVEQVTELKEELKGENEVLANTNSDLSRTVEKLKFENDTLSKILEASTSPVPEVIVNRRTGYNEVKTLVSNYVKYWNAREKDSIMNLISPDIERFYGLSKRNEISKQKVSDDISKRWKEPNSYYEIDSDKSMQVVLLNNNNFMVTLYGHWKNSESDVESTIKINDSLKLYFLRHKALD
ncbi:MAG: hypothetical protein HKN48_04595 [Flavobacteriaceae bacterium]|nr:hypothetical protein [Flavobacteriaceae bacterium]